ncbi:hypothetical protein GCM10010399_54050 [Dactylosporangium fulvum]
MAEMDHSSAGSDFQLAEDAHIHLLHFMSDRVVETDHRCILTLDAVEVDLISRGETVGTYAAHVVDAGSTC